MTIVGLRSCADRVTVHRHVHREGLRRPTASSGFPGKATGTQLDYDARFLIPAILEGPLKLSYRFALATTLSAFAGLSAAQAAAPAEAPAASAATPVMIQASAPAAAPAEPQQHCYKERKVGSNIPVTICEPVQTEAERQRAMDNLQSQNRMNSPMPAAIGR
jgi:hypothetical protein